MRIRLAHLDVLRGLAAVLVCAGHLRAFLWVDSAHVRHFSLPVKACYFLTSLGHECVVVFFVLSGYFVGGGALKAFAQKRWSWKLYAIRRLSRLWIVLLPALLLTLVLDQAGRHLAPAGYAGAYHGLYNSGPAPMGPADWRWTTLVGNVFFLQGVVVPVFGSNSPLWSLANEFWYYLLFPIIIGIFKFSQFPGKLCSFGAGVVLVFFLPAGVLLAGLIWLLGVGVHLASQNPQFKRIASRSGYLVLSGILAGGSLALIKCFPFWGGDYIVGVVFACFILGLAVCRHESAGYETFARYSGETSYTIYLTHFPLLALIFFTCFKGQKCQPDLAGCVLFLGLMAAVLVYTTAVWWCFERNTDRVRQALEARLVRGPSERGQGFLPG